MIIIFVFMLRRLKISYTCMATSKFINFVRSGDEFDEEC